MPNYRAFYKVFYDFREQDMQEAYTEAESLLYELREEYPEIEFRLESVEATGEDYE